MPDIFFIYRDKSLADNVSFWDKKTDTLRICLKIMLFYFFK